MQALNFSQLLERQFIGADDLRRDLTNILKKFPKNGGKLVITQRGKPKAVILDIVSYLEMEELTEQIADSDPKLIKRINKGVEEINAGKGVPAERVFKELGI